MAEESGAERLRDAVGRGVRAARKARGLSQQELADAVGWRRTRIADVEVGRRDLGGIPELEVICSALGVSLDELLGPEARGREAAQTLRLGPGR